jgi:transposase
MYLRATNRADWEQLVLKAVRRSGRDRARAALRLGVADRTLRSWIAELRGEGHDIPKLPPGFEAREKDA